MFRGKEIVGRDTDGNFSVIMFPVGSFQMVGTTKIMELEDKKIKSPVIVALYKIRYEKSFRNGYGREAAVYSSHEEI